MHGITRTTAPGFSILELMIVVLILGILTTSAVPAYKYLRKNNQLIAAANDSITALQFARAEAVRRGKTVRIKATDGGDRGNEYGPGLTVWIDANADGNLNDGEELSVIAKTQPGITIDSDGNLAALTFNARGETDSADTWLICDDRVGETGRTIKVLLTGLVTVGNYHCP